MSPSINSGNLIQCDGRVLTVVRHYCQRMMGKGSWCQHSPAGNLVSDFLKVRLIDVLMILIEEEGQAKSIAMSVL